MYKWLQNEDFSSLNVDFLWFESFLGDFDWGIWGGRLKEFSGNRGEIDGGLIRF
jgi:hypothetical protein